MKDIVNIPQAPGGDYRSFASRVMAGERLTQEQENKLIVRGREGKDKKSLDRVYLANTGLVYKLSDLYSSKGINKDDLIQAGMEGLAEALRAYDMEPGVPFGTYAAQWIKQSMRKCLMTNDGPVRIATSKALRKLYFNLPKHLPAGRKLTAREVVELAEKLEVSAIDIQEMEKRRRTSYMMVQHTDSHEDNESEAPESVLVPDARANPEKDALERDQTNHRRKRLEACLKGLNERQQTIIRRRYLVADEDQVARQVDLAAELGVSYQAIQQNEKKALAVFEGNIRREGGMESWL